MIAKDLPASGSNYRTSKLMQSHLQVTLSPTFEARLYEHRVIVVPPSHIVSSIGR